MIPNVHKLFPDRNKLNIGCGHNILPKSEGWVNLDRSREVGADCVFNLEAIMTGKALPFPDKTFDVMLMSHVFEHLLHPLPIMQELWRVAKPGCLLFIRVPYGSSDNAFEDPTHVRQCFFNTFMYYHQSAYARADYGYRGNWAERERLLIVRDDVDPEFLGDTPEQQLDVINMARNVVDEFAVTLEAVPFVPVSEAVPPTPQAKILYRWQLNQGADHGSTRP